MSDQLKNVSLETLLIHADRELNTTSAVTAPIYQTANFAGSSPEDFRERSSRPRHSEFYTRYGSPNAEQVETVLARLEGAESALLAGSGMAAISLAVLGLIEHGQHVVAQTSHYGGTVTLLRDVLPRFGVTVTRVDQRDTTAFAAAMRPNTKLVLLETPSNPAMWLTDLRAVAEIARAHGALTIVDGTFATPLNQLPLQLGVDLVVHSATKYFGGHSDLIAGVVLGKSELIERLWNTHVILGAAIAPFDAWLVLRGLRTLSLRVQRHNENAMALAAFLEGHPAVRAVHYPGLKSHPQHALACRQMSGFGGMLSFEVDGGYERANAVLARLQLPRIAASLGGVESLVAHAAANFAHYLTEQESESAGITSGLIRVSVGLENPADLISDFDQALSGVQEAPAASALRQGNNGLSV
ncbi:MAG TPA: aminotransferase class I/II-fold pyridoxal phosphate-dependent enzyme [Candidatus Angelobacter sp.]